MWLSKIHTKIWVKIYVMDLGPHIYGTSVLEGSIQQSLVVFEYTIQRKGRTQRIRTLRDRIHLVNGPNSRFFTTIEMRFLPFL